MDADGQKLVHQEITGEIIAAAIEVHRHLGPGLLESVYESCLAHEMSARGLEVRRQLSLPVEYKGHSIDVGFRIDLLVNDAVVVELKAIEGINRVHESQLLTYLKLSKKRVGLLINFNVQILTNGIMRRVLWTLLCVHPRKCLPPCPSVPSVVNRI